MRSKRKRRKKKTIYLNQDKVEKRSGRWWLLSLPWLGGRRGKGEGKEEEEVEDDEEMEEEKEEEEEEEGGEEANKNYNGENGGTSWRGRKTECDERRKEELGMTNMFKEGKGKRGRRNGELDKEKGNEEKERRREKRRGEEG